MHRFKTFMNEGDVQSILATVLSVEIVFVVLATLWYHECQVFQVEDSRSLGAQSVEQKSLVNRCIMELWVVQSKMAKRFW